MHAGVTPPTDVQGPPAGSVQLQLGRGVSLKRQGQRHLKAEQLERQLDTFAKGDVLAGHLQMLGRQHRRRGGAQSRLLS